jgi:GGDEF domain-containing protein
VKKMASCKDHSHHASEFEEYSFDPARYSTVCRIYSRLTGILITLFFARQKETGETYLSLQCLQKLSDTSLFEDFEKKIPLIRAFRSIVEKLNGRCTTRTAIERLSQTLQKIPNCLFEAFQAIQNQREDPIKFLDIFVIELIYLLEESHMLTSSDRFAKFLGSILKEIIPLYDIAGHYRSEEFIFFVQNKFFFEVDIANMFCTFYLDFGYAQIAEFNRGGVLIEDFQQKLASVGEKLNGGTTLREKFNTLVLDSNISLPDYDCLQE